MDHFVTVDQVNTVFEKSLKGKGDGQMSIASTKGSIHLPEHQSRNVMKMGKMVSKTYEAPANKF